MRQLQPNWIILAGVICAILGLAVGVGLGLLLSRGIQSSGQANETFAGLREGDREEFVVLVAAAYAQDHDLEGARAQLDRLGMPDLNPWIADLIDRYVTEERDEADIRALAALAQGLGVESPQVLAYSATLTPPATDTPLPAPTLAPTDTPTVTPVPPTTEPTAMPPTLTAVPSDTPLPQPTDTPTLLPTATPALSATPIPPTATAVPPDTPQPTSTPKPQPTRTPAAKWAWTARLVGPGQDGQSCSDGLKLIRVTVLDAAGNQLPGVWAYEQYSGQYQVSGHKGDDPFWGPGEVEFSQLDGGRVCIATGDGGACESDLTRDLPCHDPPPLEDLWAAGYCECCEPEITLERCRELFESGNCLGVAHYAWRVEFKRSW